MAFSITKIKFYQCAFWNEGAAHGGPIDLANPISASSITNNIFDDVSDAERSTGDTEFRKIYIRNQNEVTWAEVVAWISQFTLSPDDEISILLGSDASVQSDIASSTFVSPDSKVHADALSIGDLAENEHQAIWIKRVVDAGADGYPANQFTLTFETS